MKKFWFRLQPVLDVRMASRDTKASEVARLLGEADAEREQLSFFQGQLNQLYRKRVDPNLGDLINYQYFKETISQNIQERSQVLEEKEQMVAAAREALVQAEKECMSLEILKEKEKSSYLKQVALEEQNFLDEIGTIKFSTMQNYERR